MSQLKDRIKSSLPIRNPRSRLILLVLVVMVAMLAVISVSYADVPGGRPTPDNVSVPNPGTQEQELANITFPAPYNTFEFVVTCGACHGGTVDQQAGHFANWAGSAHANACEGRATDPIRGAHRGSGEGIEDWSGDRHGWCERQVIQPVGVGWRAEGRG